MQESTPTATNALAKAGEALMRGAFQEARELFEASLSQEETPEALEGLGTAAAWLDDADTASDARERAYRGYRKRGAVLESGRVAMTLGMMHFQFLGAPDIARGWMRRAHRILEDVDPTPYHGWVALGEGAIAAVYDKDPATALELSQQAVAIGRSQKDIHLEMMGISQAGLAMVMAGNVKEGMPLLDEAAAAAVGGDLTDQSVITNACCYMLMACQRVRDYNRGVQWARKAMDYCRDWADRATFSYCRSVGATMLIWQGKWDEGERELVSTLAEVGESKPSVRALASAGLADLRRRQGRFEDAGALLDELGADALGGAFGPEILLERAALALDRGSPADASDLAERYLRMVPPGIPLERLDALAAHALARLRVGDVGGAGGSLGELEEVAASLGTEAVRGSAAFTRGVAAVVEGDLEEARRSLEDAVDLFERSRGVQESGRARLELAGVLAELDRREAAEHEAKVALTSLSELGAAADAAAAEDMLRRLGSRAGPRAEGGATLTEREAGILRELAKGLSNQEIAEALFLSVRTVERHISNIYAKVGARGKAARAAATAWAHTHGLA
jgi:ATP/maltotriose-dependent transcriptional regulator MalT